MALLIDEAAPFDVEIVDDWMFVYSNVAFRTGDANLYARLFRIIDTVGAKTLTQTDRYVDARVGDFAANVVAPAGRTAEAQRLGGRDRHRRGVRRSSGSGGSWATGSARC